MLQNFDDALAETGAETFEDEMRVGFADGAFVCVGDVAPEEDVVQRERGRGTVREMRDCERGGRAAVFVQEDDIAESICLSAFHQVRQDQIPSIQTYSCW